MLQSILSKSKALKTSTLVFLDISKAFDNIGHTHLRNTLFSMNIPTKLANVIIELQINNTTQIETNNDKTDPIKINLGVMQGSPLSPQHFITWLPIIFFKNFLPLKYQTNMDIL